MATLNGIRETHQRAEDSTKGAGEWFADHAGDAHDHRGILIQEVHRLREALLKIEDRTTDPVAKSIAGETLVSGLPLSL